MAGIEKVCEYSGDYEGGIMYKHKRDHIQVLKKYRKHFKGKKGYLYFVDVPEVRIENYPRRWLCLRFSLRSRLIRWKIIPKFWSPVWWVPELRKYSLWHYYILYVPECPGKVDGLYLNWTYSPAKVIRNLNRLVDLRWIDYLEGSTNMTFRDMVKEDIESNF